MKPISEKITLARAFGARMQELPRAQFRQVIDRNKCESNDLICHSHDFVDANMVMLAAFEDVYKRAIDMDNEEELELWNDAWAIAKAADFFA